MGIKFPDKAAYEEAAIFWMAKFSIQFPTVTLSELLIMLFITTFAEMENGHPCTGYREGSEASPQGRQLPVKLCR